MPLPCEFHVESCKKGCQESVCEIIICREDDSLCVAGDVLNDLRSDLIGELGAINQYSQHFLKWKDRCPEAARLFCDTMNDEKVHVAEFTRLIAKLDPAQAKAFKEVGCPFKG